MRKTFIIEFSSLRLQKRGYLEAENMAEALQWLSDNLPASKSKSKIKSIKEGNKDDLNNIREII